MTREETRERIAVMQAYVDGAAIEAWIGYLDSGCWVSVENTPHWDPDIHYRIVSKLTAKPTTDTRPMTHDKVIGFLANTKGIVIRYRTSPWFTPVTFPPLGLANFDDYEWTTVSLEGIYGEPHKFEIVEPIKQEGGR